MSVAGLKKQFYKASQVSGGRAGRGGGGVRRAPGSRLLGWGPGDARPGPDSGREPEVGRGDLGTRPSQGGYSLGGTGSACEGAPGSVSPCGLQSPRGWWADGGGQRCTQRLFPDMDPSPPVLPSKRSGRERREREEEEAVRRLSTQRAQGQGILCREQFFFQR